MANPFYIYSGAFLPGILARAEAETAEFQSVQQGFNLLAIQGTDSGAANAYVVTTQGGQDGVYKDGMIVEFKAKNANTGGSTIAVDSGATVSITQPNGVNIVAGAIAANSWIRLLYNSTYSAFTLVAPTSLITSSSTISAAAPTNKVGLTAAGGVSLAVVPIDATYAIDQSIAPTWTGVHTFSNTVAFNSTVTFAAALTLNGLANSYPLTLVGSSTASQSLGLLVKSGTNASDFCVRLQSQGATDYFKILGEGSVVVGNPTGGAKGVGTINAQNLYVNGAAVLTSTASSANPSATIGLSAVNGTALTFMTSDSAPPLSQGITPTWTGAHTFSYTGGAPVTVNAAANKVGIVVNGGTNTSNQYLVEILTGAGSGFSSGLLVEAGTNSSDYCVRFMKNAAGNDYFDIFGDGSGQGFSGAAATNGISWTANGNITVNAPVSGSALTVKGVSAGIPLDIQGITTTSYARWLRSGTTVGYVGSADSLVSGGSSSDFAVMAINGLSLGYNNGTKAIGVDTSGNITLVGAVTCNSTINAQSDATLKHDIRPVSRALEIVEKLSGVHFRWNSNDEASLGVIAQEVQAVLPDLVTTNPSTGKLAVQYNGLIAVLIEAVKELAAR